MTQQQKHPRILALILAGGQGGRMDTLTEQRAKPALPFGGSYRLIDFPLSNCAHSGLSDVWIVEQYEPFHLNAHLANGRPWDLDRLRGGLRVLPPYEARPEKDEKDGSGFAQGNADALWRNRRFLREFAPDLLLVLSADHVYRLDFRDVVESHLNRPAEAVLTLVHTDVPEGDDACRFGNVVLDADGRVTDFAYKPDEPISSRITTEIFLYDAPALLRSLEELAARGSDGSSEEATLRDFGHELVPYLVEQGTVYGFPPKGYWRDVGTLDSYTAAHRELLRGEGGLEPDAPDWPILTFDAPRMPARIEGAARIDRSLVSPGCRIAGTVERSVLSPGVVVEEGAHVRDAILYRDSIVRAGATVEQAIVDEGAVVGPDARVGAAGGEITVLGRNVEVGAGETVPAGEHRSVRKEEEA